MSGHDAKYFSRAKVAKLRSDLTADLRDGGGGGGLNSLSNSGISSTSVGTSGRSSKEAKSIALKRSALKRILANLTLANNDMVLLFTEVTSCMAIPVLDIKKMCFHYLIQFARLKPDVALLALPILLQDIRSDDALIRGLALRTISYVPLAAFARQLAPLLPSLLSDHDPYIRKTAAMAVAKLYEQDAQLVTSPLGAASSNHSIKPSFSDIDDGLTNCTLIGRLTLLVHDSNPTVVSSALTALLDIWERCNTISFSLSFSTTLKVIECLPRCSEWGQVSIMEWVMNFVPHNSDEAIKLTERLAPNLSHSNSTVLLTCIRVLLYLTHYINDDAVIMGICAKFSPRLVSLLVKEPEIQYIALRNTLLILQRYPEIGQYYDIRAFFCKYNEPIFVKASKLEIIFTLTTSDNVESVLRELQEYAAENDVEFVRKAVRAIGKLALKIENAASRCIATLLDLVATRVPYIVQETTVVMRNIFRRYPNQYEGLIGSLCENLDSVEDADAKAAMIWVIGQYADRIENAPTLLEDFLYTFLDEPAEVQLALLTATVKVFMHRPKSAQHLVPRTLYWATMKSGNPDVRERGFMYQRLLAADDTFSRARLIVLGDKLNQNESAMIKCDVQPSTTKALTMESDAVWSMNRWNLSSDAELIHPETLQELILHVGTLASVYLKPINTIFRNSRTHKLVYSPALRTQWQRNSTVIRGQCPTGTVGSSDELVNVNGFVIHQTSATTATATHENRDKLPSLPNISTSLSSPSVPISSLVVPSITVLPNPPRQLIEDSDDPDLHLKLPREGSSVGHMDYFTASFDVTDVPLDKLTLQDTHVKSSNIQDPASMGYTHYA